MSFKTKAPTQWTTGECVAWLSSLGSVPRELRTALMKEFLAEKIKGSDLPDVFEDAGAVRAQLSTRLPSLKPMDAKKVVDAFDAVKKSRRSHSASIVNAAAASALASASTPASSNYNSIRPGSSFLRMWGTSTNTNTTTTTSSTFTVFISGMRPSAVVKIKNIRARHTVKDLKRFIADQEYVSVEEFGLQRGKELTDGHTMAYCGIVHETVVHYFSLTNGGTSVPNKGKVRNRRHINWSAHPNIRKSRKPDCLFAYRMREGYSVARMPCGHAMECDSMYQYINSTIKANVAHMRIFCPVPDCKCEWDFKLCCRVAGMDDNEYVEYARKKDLREGDDIRICPHCGATCKRKPAVAILRMNCGSCSNSDWCWVCGKLWKSSNLMYCGNANCKFIADINEQLASCGASVPGGWKAMDLPENEKKLPNIRSCPACLRFIKKPDGCKHMTCQGCKNEFCFACLRTQKACNADKGSSHTVFCFVAPRQRFS